MAKTTPAAPTETTEEVTSTALATQNTGLVAAPTFMDASDFGNDASGFEGIDKDSFAIPFFMVLQKTSPLVDDDHAKYVPGAKAGMFYNTVTGALYDGKAGLIIVPAFFKRSYVEWGGRESANGGFKGEYTPEQIAAMVDTGEIVVLDGQYYRPDEDGVSVKEPKKNNYFADTRAHYIIAVGTPVGKTEEESGVGVLALSGTLSKASRTLMTILDQKRVDVGGVKKRPPTFANRVKMTTIGMSNAKGTWSGVKFELDGLVQDAGLFGDAKQFYLNITGNKVKADFAKADANTSGHDDGEASDEPTTADKF